MTRTALDAELRVFQPGETSPATTIPQADIKSIGIQQQVGTLVDSGDITIYNDGGQYTDAITTGDRVEVYLQLQGETGLTHRWTCIARPPTLRPGPGDPTLQFQADDFVFRTLAFRTVFAEFEDTQVDTIIESVVSDAAPEVALNVGSLTTTTDYTARGDTALQILKDLLTVGDAVAYNDDQTLVVEPVEAITAGTSLDRATDIGIPEVSGADDQLVNEVRVEGGQGAAIDDQQPTQSTTTTVTSTSRLTTQIDTRKSEVTRVDVYTKLTGSGEDLIVRLQKDEGGSPVAIDDPQSDIARRTLAPQFIDDGGLTTFLLPEHTLPEPRPHLIIESSGSSGQKIGTNGSGVPRYDAYFPFPLIVRASRRQSIDEYRRRETRITDESLSSLAEVQARAEAELDRHATPRHQFSAPAESVAAHSLRPGDGVSVQWPDLGLTGSLVIKQVQDQYEGVRLETDLQAILIDSLI